MLDHVSIGVKDLTRRDNGKPGIRADYHPTNYAAFVVDPDGYRLEAYCRTDA